MTDKYSHYEKKNVLQEFSGKFKGRRQKRGKWMFKDMGAANEYDKAFFPWEIQARNSANYTHTAVHPLPQSPAPQRNS